MTDFAEKENEELLKKLEGYRNIRLAEAIQKFKDDEQS